MKFGIYKHNKTGNLYQVLHVAKHTETSEQFVVYKRCTNENIWVRPYDMFNEIIELDGKHVPRFEYQHETKERK